MLSTLTKLITRAQPVAKSLFRKVLREPATAPTGQAQIPHSPFCTPNSRRAPLFRPFLMAAPRAGKFPGFRRASDLFLLLMISALALIAGRAMAQDVSDRNWNSLPPVAGHRACIFLKEAVSAPQRFRRIECNEIC